jgi:dienelactone hydrolase
MRAIIPVFILFILLSCEQNSTSTSLSFKLSFTKEMSEQAQDGRLLLLLANNDKSEPRFQINDGLTTQLVFGIDVEVDYGDRAEHCWNGDHENPNYVSRLRYNTMYLPKILKRIQESAPKDADTRSWRY